MVKKGFNIAPGAYLVRSMTGKWTKRGNSDKYWYNHSKTVYALVFLPISDSRVPGLRKPYNDVQPSIVEAEAKGHVEETLERTNVISSSFSFTPPCDDLSA